VYFNERSTNFTFEIQTNSVHVWEKGLSVILFTGQSVSTLFARG
jgi:hypothetical protein